MPGYYKKAPLVYVTASFSCSRFPKLDESEQDKLFKAMIASGLPDRQVSKTPEFNVNFEGTSLKTQHSEYERTGFFSADKRECLLFTPDSIEFRVTNYFKFGQFCERLDELLKAAFSAVSEFSLAALREVVLNYSDTIVPMAERKLLDYFKEASILPLSFLQEYEDDVQQAGQTQATRIVKPDLRVAISLEQMPVLEQQVQRWLPQRMVERDPLLSMPLDIRSEGSNISAKYYGILLTQGGKLINKTLKDTDINGELDSVHGEVKRTFTALLNREVCNEDWEYVAE